MKKVLLCTILAGFSLFSFAAQSSNKNLERESLKLRKFLHGSRGITCSSKKLGSVTFSVLNAKEAIHDGFELGSQEGNSVVTVAETDGSMSYGTDEVSEVVVGRHILITWGEESNYTLVMDSASNDGLSLFSMVLLNDDQEGAKVTCGLTD